MDRNDEWEAIEDLEEDASKMRVPGMAMDHINLSRIARKGHTRMEGLQGRGKRRWSRGDQGLVTVQSVDLEASLLVILGAKGTDFDWRQCSELTGQILHMDPSAAINMRWILVCQQKNSHLHGHLPLPPVGVTKVSATRCTEKQCVVAMPYKSACDSLQKEVRLSCIFTSVFCTSSVADQL